MTYKYRLENHIRGLIYLLFLIAILILDLEFSDELLVFALLMLPATDREWLKHASIKFSLVEMLVFALAIAIVLYVIPEQRGFIIRNLFYAAAPEEWYFRVYLIDRFGFNIWANLLSTIYFSILHAIEFGFVKGFYVVIPSLFYGWLYIKTRSPFFVIFAHLVSNIIYIEYITY